MIGASPSAVTKRPLTRWNPGRAALGTHRRRFLELESRQRPLPRTLSTTNRSGYSAPLALDSSLQLTLGHLRATLDVQALRLPVKLLLRSFLTHRHTRTPFRVFDRSSLPEHSHGKQRTPENASQPGFFRNTAAEDRGSIVVRSFLPLRALRAEHRQVVVDVEVSAPLVGRVLDRVRRVGRTPCRRMTQRRPAVKRGAEP